MEMVRLTQKRGMKGSQGDWKEFLNSHDPKFGASMSDPSKRPNDLLIAFLKTFSKEDDLMVMNRFSVYHKRHVMFVFTDYQTKSFKNHVYVFVTSFWTKYSSVTRSAIL